MTLIARLGTGCPAYGKETTVMDRSPYDACAATEFAQLPNLPAGATAG